MNDKFQSSASQRGFRDLLHWLMHRKPIEWPTYVASESQKVLFDYVKDGQLRVTFINHSTFLIQANGLNILTDPIWSKRAGPWGILGPKRVIDPGVRFEDLPKIDVVLISHNHYDHLDLPTLKRLQGTHNPQFLVGKGNKTFLERQGIQHVQEFVWWEEQVLEKGPKITFVPAQHFSRRGLLDHNKTLWGGFVIQFQGDAGVIYFTGDSGFGPHFQQIKDYCGDIRLALLPIGAYSPRWFMAPVHLSPDDAAKVHQLLNPIISIGMHFGTFQLADEGYDDPANELRSALRRYKILPDRFRLIEPGHGLDVPICPEVIPPLA